MPSLPTDLRTQLERTIIAARDVAETAARASLIALAVERDAPPAATTGIQCCPTKLIATTQTRHPL